MQKKIVIHDYENKQGMEGRGGGDGWRMNKLWE